MGPSLGQMNWLNILDGLKKYSRDLKRSRESLFFNLLSSVNLKLHFMICACSRCKIGSVI